MLENVAAMTQILYTTYRISSNSIRKSNSIRPRLVSAPAHPNNWGQVVREAERSAKGEAREDGGSWSMYTSGKTPVRVGKSNTSQLLVVHTRLCFITWRQRWCHHVHEIIVSAPE